MLQRIKDLLMISEIQNGELDLMAASPDEMKKAYDILSKALMDRELPHYRVIGVVVTTNSRPAEDIVSKQKGMDKSYIELFKSLNDLVFSRGGGERDAIEWDISENGLANRGFIQAVGNINTSKNNMTFVGEGQSSLETLIQDVDILKLDSGCVFKAVTMRGTGMCDIYDSEAELSKLKPKGSQDKRGYNRSGLIPVRAVYDLNSIVMLKPYLPGDGTVLKFFYKQKVNEKVLNEIIHDFAETMSAEEDDGELDSLM